MPPIHQTQWEQDDEERTCDMRLTLTDDGRIKMTSLQEEGYEQTFSNPKEAGVAFNELLQKGQQQQAS